MSEFRDLEPPGDEDEDGGVVINLDTSVDPLLAQWSRFRPLFVEALAADGYWSVEDLEQRIAHRRAFFFPGHATALVGQIEQYPTGVKVFQILWCVGDVAEAVQMAPGVEAVARMMGCDRMFIEGRPAWAKVLKPYGYDVFSVTIVKEL